MSFIKVKSFSASSIPLLLLFIVTGLLTVNKLNAQIINEGFEESEWSNVLASNTLTGTIALSAPAPNSTQTYYTATW